MLNSRFFRFQHVLFIITALAIIPVAMARVRLLWLCNADTGGLEFELIYEIQRLIVGDPIYIDPAIPPFQITQKTPIYHIIVAFCAWLCHMPAENIFGIYFLSRIITLLTVIGIGILSYVLAREIFGLSRNFSLVNAVFSIIILSHSHHYHSRMDALYTLSFLALYYILTKNNWSINFHKALLYVSITVLIFYIKQNGLVVIPIIALSLYINQQASKWILFYGLTSLMIIVLLPVIFSQDMKALYQNVVIGINNGLSYGFIRDYFLSEFQLSFLALVVAGQIVFYNFLVLELRSNKLFFLCFFTICTFLIGVLMSFKYGAGPNYFTEFKLFSLLSVLLAFERLKNYSPSFEHLGKVYLCLTLSVTGIMGVKQYFNYQLEHKYKNEMVSYETQRRIGEVIVEELGIGKNEFVYGQEHGFLNNILFDHFLLPTRSVFHPSFYLQKRNGKTHSAFLNYMEAGIAKYLILRRESDVTDYSIFDLSFSAYKPIREVDGFVIYRREKKEEK